MVLQAEKIGVKLREEKQHLQLETLYTLKQFKFFCFAKLIKLIIRHLHFRITLCK